MKIATGILVAVPLAIAVCSGLVLAQEEGGRKWSFNDDEIGMVPSGWTPAETNGDDLLATWKVVGESTAPLPPNALLVTETRNTGSTFNLLIAGNTSYQDVDLSAHLKAVSGEEDRGGGVVWRALDAQNYYMARWNPLENNFRLYAVRDGRRKMLGSTDTKADPQAWHRIYIQMVGDRITARFDDGHFLEVQDATIAKPGRIGLWTKADAETLFDEVTVAPATAQEGAPTPVPANP